MHEQVVIGSVELPLYGLLGIVLNIFKQSLRFGRTKDILVRLLDDGKTLHVFTRLDTAPSEA